MIERVSNSYITSRAQASDTLKPKSEEEKKDFNPNDGLIGSYLGSDGLNLSKEASFNFTYEQEKSFFERYQATFKFLGFALLALILLVGFITTMIIFGGVLFLLIAFLFTTITVFLSSINLNPFKKSTYKRMKKALNI